MAFFRGKRRSFRSRPARARSRPTTSSASRRSRMVKLGVSPTCGAARRSTVFANEWNVPPATRSQLRADQRRRPPQHLLGRLPRERQQQDAPRRHAGLDQPRDAVHQRPRLAAAGAGDDEHRAVERGRRVVLRFVQLARIVDLVSTRRARLRRLAQRVGFHRGSAECSPRSAGRQTLGAGSGLLGRVPHDAAVVGAPAEATRRAAYSAYGSVAAALSPPRGHPPPPGRCAARETRRLGGARGVSGAAHRCRCGRKPDGAIAAAGPARRGRRIVRRGGSSARSRRSVRHRATVARGAVAGAPRRRERGRYGAIGGVGRAPRRLRGAPATAPRAKRGSTRRRDGPGQSRLQSLRTSSAQNAA